MTMYIYQPYTRYS